MQVTPTPDPSPQGGGGRLSATESKCALALHPLGAEQPAIDADVRAFDRTGADRLGIIIRRAHAADDGVAVAGVLHVLETGEEQCLANAAFPRLGIDTGRPEEIAA